ncbi:MAG: CBS domain-containing protein [Dehalococcoidales bacterium]|nr:CBS domain-containing protein [Dehalococcoidales bacterium]
MKAKHLMIREVMTARPEMSVEDALRLMVERHISGLPVVDAEGRVVGVFSGTDALAREGKQVGDLMTAPAITVDQECTVEEVAVLLAAKDINRVPVVHEGRLAGIISRADIVRYVATKWAWHEAR